MNIKTLDYSDYWDYEETFKHFLRCSLLNCWHRFNFEEALESAITPIQNKLIEHGQGTLEEFMDHEDGFRSTGNLEEYITQTDYIYITQEDIHEAIMKYRYEKFKEKFSGYFSDLEEIIEKYNNWQSMKTPEIIALFDTIIHSQHVNGDIFEDIDTEAIKEEIEQEYKEYTKNYTINML